MKHLTLLLLLFVSATLMAQTPDTLKTDTLSPDTIKPLPPTPAYDVALDSLIHDFYIQRAFHADCHFADATPAPSCSDSLYVDRLQHLPYVMEMPFNREVKSFIEMYLRRHRQVSYMAGLGNSYYFKMFEQALAKYDVPLELCYLPVIESALNAHAVSSAGAAGLWQFMIFTGRDYGLEVNSLVDERMDPMKASDAAARYLRDLYRIYNDWHLVIAAYNCGPGNVAKAMRRSGKTTYWEIYNFLPQETRGYVPIFIAANYVMNYYKEHNICPAKSIYNYAVDTVMITDRVHLRQIADVIDIPYDELQFLNPQYKKNIIPGNIKPYPLVLPLNKITAYDANRDTILNYMPELSARLDRVQAGGSSSSRSGGSSSGGRYYKVRQGDTLSSIAKRNHTTVAQIQRLNGLRSTTIRVGQSLKIR